MMHRTNNRNVTKPSISQIVKSRLKYKVNSQYFSFVLTRNNMLFSAIIGDKKIMEIIYWFRANDLKLPVF